MPNSQINPHPAPHLHPRVLFVLRKRQSYENWHAYSYSPASSGLYNSAKFVVNMLKKLGIDVKMVQVVDANAVDREVHKYKPTHVIFEAVWMPPSKFSELTKLYPDIFWTVRVHSEVPFIANEGMAMNWLIQYPKFDKVSISANSLRTLEEFRTVTSGANPSWSEGKVRDKVMYLPNYYPVEEFEELFEKNEDRDCNGKRYLDVGCFGAIRPMKNQLMQGVAAVKAASVLKKKLRFHINASRVEQSGEPVVKNLQALMDGTGNQLVKEPWLDHDNFVQLITSMDIGMQVSFSETFSIVAADTIVAGLPIVVSPEIYWISTWSKADPTNSDDIVRAMLLALDPHHMKRLKRLNLHGLMQIGVEAQEEWLHCLNVLHPQDQSKSKGNTNHVRLG